ncbi:MAG: DUF2911 domain-containing protein [Bacteroidetes bacterium]|nr:DUF2911 domain-containing protein [Bacteroidota bacterium]
MKLATIVSAMLVVSTVAVAQNPPLSPKATAEGKGVKVVYSQPSKKGRVIFGGLVPYGQVWRTGANNATEITFDKDGTLGGKPVKAGTYTLWTIPGEKEWSIILNSDTKFWGTQYEQHKEKDILKVEVPSKAINDEVEKFTIRFEGKNMILEWDKTQVSVPVSVQ